MPRDRYDGYGGNEACEVWATPDSFTYTSGLYAERPYQAKYRCFNCSQNCVNKHTFQMFK